MDFNDKRFGGSPGNGRDERDRTVPPDENYYGGYDLDFNNRSRDDIRNGVNRQNAERSGERYYRGGQGDFEDVYSGGKGGKNARRRSL